MRQVSPPGIQAAGVCAIEGKFKPGPKKSAARDFLAALKIRMRLTKKECRLPQAPDLVLEARAAEERAYWSDVEQQHSLNPRREGHR